MRTMTLAEGEFYHVFNRGIDGQPISRDNFDSDRFVESLVEFNDLEPTGGHYALNFESGAARKSGKSLVEIVAYCLNPNHYHLILKQTAEIGISKYLKRVVGGYVQYFNGKHKRQGPLFQGPYKVKHVTDNSYLLHLSAYVNLNDKVHSLSNPVAKLVRTSWGEYENGARGICSKDIVLEQFPNPEAYSSYATDALVGMLEKRPEYAALKALSFDH